MTRTGTATMPAALGEGRPAAFGTGLPRSHPIPSERTEFPAPVLGLMEIPAVVRRPFPVPCVGLMELPTYA